MLTLRWKECYRVDNVPLFIRPIWLVICAILGVTQYCVVHLIPHFTSKIQITGNDPRLTGAPSFINPDGPSGPNHELKRGVLHLAALSGLAIVPVRIKAFSESRLRGWDKNSYPCRLEVHFGEPISVNESNFTAAEISLRSELGGNEKTEGRKL